MFADLDWIGLDWIGLDWTGLDWIGLVKYTEQLLETPDGARCL